MSVTVAEMTKEELRELIEFSIEQKLLEIFGDPEEEMELKESVQKQLQRQKAAVANGERGRTLDSVIKHYWSQKGNLSVIFGSYLCRQL